MRHQPLDKHQRACIAELWKQANKQTRDNKGRFIPLAPRSANGKDSSSTRAEAVKTFKVSRKKIDKAAEVYKARGSRGAISPRAEPSKGGCRRSRSFIRLSISALDATAVSN